MPDLDSLWLEFSNGLHYQNKCNSDYRALATISGNFASAKLLMEAIRHFCLLPNLDILIIQPGTKYQLCTDEPQEKCGLALNWLNTHLTYNLNIEYGIESSQLIERLLDSQNSHLFQKIDYDDKDFGLTCSVQISSLRYSQIKQLLSELQLHHIIKLSVKRCFYPFEDLDLIEIFDFESKSIQMD
jgi:hypothetical protein